MVNIQNKYNTNVIISSFLITLGLLINEYTLDYLNLSERLNYGDVDNFIGFFFLPKMIILLRIFEISMISLGTYLLFFLKKEINGRFRLFFQFYIGFIILFLFSFKNDSAILKELYVQFIYWQETSYNIFILIFYFLISIGTSLCTLILLYQNNIITRFIAYLLFFLCTVFTNYYGHYDFNVTANLFHIIFTELTIAQNYLGIVLNEIPSFIVLPFIAIIIIEIMHKTDILIKVQLKYFLIPLLIFLVSIIFSIQFNGKLNNYASLYKVPNAFISYLFLFSDKKQTRKDIYFSKTENHQVDNIIFIVCESVHGKRLSINDYSEDTTPYLKSISSRIFNYGIASSAFDHTIFSHRIMVKGVRSDEVLEIQNILESRPSIFQYAKKANYNVHYLDAQYPYHDNPILSDHDKFYVDKTYYTSASQELRSENNNYKKDFFLADKITEMLENRVNSKNFFYVNKAGAHEPFELSYPQDQKAFKPTLSKYETFSTWEKTSNSYYNSIRWNVDEFFKYLIKKTDKFQNVLIIYTSDHGSHLVRESRFNKNTKINDESLLANVPLFITYSKINEYLFEQLQSSTNLNKNKLSHFEIFPTLLLLFGYNEESINQYYGKTIFQKSNNDRKVFKGDYHNIYRDKPLPFNL